MSETYKLPRSGEAPITFRGERLASSDGRQHLGRDQVRWHELAVYRVEGDGYLVAVGYRSQWQGETGHDRAELVRDAAGVRALLKEYDPAAHVAGFPAGPNYEDKQARLLADIRARYQAQVSALLDRDEFAEPAESALTGLEDRRDLRRYRRLVEIGLRELELTEAEASLLCDANNGIGSFELVDPDHAEWRFWPANVEDAIRLNRLDRKWEVDAAALLAKVRAMSALQLMAVADAMERFWREPQRDSGEMLRELGLVRGPHETA